MSVTGSIETTAGTGGIRFAELELEQHRFRSDCIEPGYRPRCLSCGRESKQHRYYH